MNPSQVDPALTIDSMYEEVADLAARVVGAEADPDDVPSRRQLVAVRTGDGSPATNVIAAGLREAFATEGSEGRLKASIAQLEDDTYWAATGLLEELMEGVDRLNSAAASGESSQIWEAFDGYQRSIHVLERMYRRLEREALDDGCTAAQFVIRQLAEVEDHDLAELLAEDPAYIADLRSETDRAVPPNAPWDEARATLIAQIVFELRETATSEAIVAWFSAPRSEMDDLTPLESIQRLGTYEAGRVLRDLARASRGQVAT
jgi:hypothetical protein